MEGERVFCGAGTCSNKCPAKNSNDFSGIFCRIVKAEIEAKEAEKKAWQKMEDYYSLKIEGEK